MGKKEGERHQQQLVGGVEAEQGQSLLVIERPSAASPLGLNTVGVAGGDATIRDVQLVEAERLAVWDAHTRGLTEGSHMQPVLPSEWASCYEWMEERGFFFCKLCWKCADEQHVHSRTHRSRMCHPAAYLTEHIQQCYLEQAQWSFSPSRPSDTPPHPHPPPPPPPPPPPLSPPHPQTTAPITVYWVCFV